MINHKLVAPVFLQAQPVSHSKCPTLTRAAYFVRNANENLFIVFCHEVINRLSSNNYEFFKNCKPAIRPDINLYSPRIDL